MNTAINFRTRLGKSVTFFAFPPNAEWNYNGGLYAFGYRHGSLWSIQYIGKTECFRERGFTTKHDHWPRARQLGATHILAAVIHDAQQRDTLERELIENYNPPLNTVFNRG